MAIENLSLETIAQSMTLDRIAERVQMNAKLDHWREFWREVAYRRVVMRSLKPF